MQGQSADSLRSRDMLEDSITISFQLPHSTQAFKLDSSITDFTYRFPIPWHHVSLGNTGTATRSLLFTPSLISGWQHGHDAFSVYRWDESTARFYTTTRPYTELGYMLGGKTEQIIDVMHTQNVKPTWNLHARYRLINSPGNYKNQRTNHNNYFLTSWYQSYNRRYNNYMVVAANALQSEESGGIMTDQDYLENPIYDDRFNIPTKIGGDKQFGTNFFNSNLNTGNRYSDLSLSLRQQYDLGRKDSIVSDSTVIPLFFPRLRFEHKFSFNSYKFRFIDYRNAQIGYVPDSAYYQDNYDITLGAGDDSIKLEERWRELRNDFSIYTFPDVTNTQQFLRLGAMIQHLKAEFDRGPDAFFNASVNAEYRNRTKNKLWDMAASGSLHIAGLNAGDFHTDISLRRYSGKRQAYIELGFRNVNRKPAFIFDTRSSFYLDDPKDTKNENIIQAYGSYFIPSLDLKLSANYFLVSNYTYIADYYRVRQEQTVFNLLHGSAEKIFFIGRSWVWRADLHFQQIAGDVALKLPLLLMRSRIGYEGKLGFRNLNIAFGLEGRYHTPYKAPGYSPLLGKFSLQDTTTIRNRPDVAGYVHFRIRSFKAYVRAENLNSITLNNGFGFREHFFGVPDYPYPGFILRVGIYWNFVN